MSDRKISIFGDLRAIFRPTGPKPTVTFCFISKISEYNDILKSFDSVDPSLAILDIYTSIQLVAWENDSEKIRNDSYENICIELSYPPIPLGEVGLTNHCFCRYMYPNGHVTCLVGILTGRHSRYHNHAIMDKSLNNTAQTAFEDLSTR